MKKTRGKEIIINYGNKSPEKVTQESLRRGKTRRACELIEMARELGEKHLCEVWEE